jgi:hypothetical protein
LFSAQVQKLRERCSWSCSSFRSCIIDAETIACNERGFADFELIRSYSPDHAVTLCAFDLLEIDGSDLRREPIKKRKDRLADLLRRSHPGIVFNEHYADDGAIIYKHACAFVARARFQAPWFSVSVRPIARLDQGQEPGRTRCKAGSG